MPLLLQLLLLPLVLSLVAIGMPTSLRLCRRPLLLPPAAASLLPLLLLTASVW
jgi:hypothetical protein